jgi:hypothetical protein
MIKANELRIRNLFLLPDLNEIVEVITISKNLIGYKSKRRVGECTLEFAKPIPLTEEILLKCGGKLNSKLVIFDRFQLYYLLSCKEWYVTDLKTSCYMTNIKFLHEWQNFVFTMNGKELEINL